MGDRGSALRVGGKLIHSAYSISRGFGYRSRWLERRGETTGTQKNISRYEPWRVSRRCQSVSLRD